MATKKAKREAALAKREAYIEEVRQSGLAAQKQSRADADDAVLGRIITELNGRPNLKRETTVDEVIDFIRGTKEERLKIWNAE